MQYDDLPGAASTNIEARIQELREDGVDKELAFPNAILALFHYPDKELRERAFRIYNEYIAELQEHSNGHFYGAGLINWWDPAGAKRTLAELKSLGLKTFLLPLNPGKDDDGNVIDYGSDSDEAGVGRDRRRRSPGHAPHRRDPAEERRVEFNSVVVGMMINIDGFREQFAKYLFSGILDDHPELRIGWFEGGIAWVPWALQDAEHLVASYQHMFNRPLEHDVRYYWDTHMSASFMVDPLGLQLIDQIGVDKVMWSQRLSAQRKHFRLLGEVAGRRRRRRRARGRGQDRQRQHHEVLGAVGHLDDVNHLDSGRTCVCTRYPGDTGPDPDASRDRCAAALGDGRSRRRRPDPAGKQQRRLRDRGELAAAATPGCPMSSDRSLWCSPTTASASVPAVPRGRPHRSQVCPPTICTARCIWNSTRAWRISRRTGRRTGPGRGRDRGRRAHRGHAARGDSPAVPVRHDRPTPRRSSAPPSWSRRRTNWPASAPQCRITDTAMVDVQAALAPGIRQIDLSASSCAGHSNSARWPACSSRSGR